MAPQILSAPLVIALAGNPNAGKTSLLNRLTRMRAKVGNYPGVTVERVAGRFRTPTGREIEVIDLPGTYSFVSHSPDERVALDVILGRIPGIPAPQCVVAVVDASNLERNLYLVEQMRDLHLPVVVALNMIDVAEKRGARIDADAMSRILGVPVFPMDARTGRGVDELTRHLERFQSAPERGADTGREQALLTSDAALITERYRRIEALCGEVISRSAAPSRTGSDQIDKVLTHRVWGPVIFLSAMALIFISIFHWATPLMDLIEAGKEALAAGASAVLPDGVLRGLLVGGVIEGVGNVVIFLPQIVILFIFLSIIEDSGYMARAAFIMDRAMKSIGLSGRSFIPLLGSFACAIPGIMATRTIANSRDRLATILVAPFMSCSARLPIYVLVTGAFFPSALKAGLVVFSMYLLGIAAAVGSAFLFKRVIFPGEPEPFVLELPPYRWPVLRNIYVTVKLRAKAFLMRAGTTILAITIVLWFLINFPPQPQIEAEYALRRAAVTSQEDMLQLAVEERSALLRESFAGQIGHFIEPVVKPLGFDWKIGIGLVASFAAREVLVSTMGVIYAVDAGDEPAPISEAMLADRWPDGSPIFTPLVGFSILVFFVLACQCMSTLAVVQRETNSWKWPVFMFSYMTILAYLASLLVYQGGRLLGLG